ncbi:MAG: symmetrical bis(5'-nucleosyl)-tetraphosphatase, partial [Gammaproteobacteria bacterium]|nr:symmetrical bis(5'-nucleosyl)-tetraphosphatase [Gammaproteobacteria bacterium]
MALYAIGDIQGCYQSLNELLGVIHFEPAADRLWFTGDLVNRGPESLATLRFVRDLADRAVTVLGNHDLHLLAIAWGGRKQARGDTLDAVLKAPDRDELLAWLRNRPLAVDDPELGVFMVHAGLLPQWSLQDAMSCAEELENTLRSDAAPRYFETMSGNTPNIWDKRLTGWPRLRLITN